MDKIELNRNDLICPICKEPFIEPIFIPSCGHHSCRCCLLELYRSDIDNNRKCTICLVEFIDIFTLDYITNVKPNHMLSNLVEENFSVKCINNGCDIKILESKQEEHNKKCPYQIIECKNRFNGCRIKVIRKDLFIHMDSCDFYYCIGKRYGCIFKSNKINLQEHQNTCIYKKIGKNLENKFIENMTCYVDEKCKNIESNLDKKIKTLELHLKSMDRNLLIIKRKVNKITNETNNTYLNNNDYYPIRYNSPRIRNREILIREPEENRQPPLPQQSSIPLETDIVEPPRRTAFNNSLRNIVNNYVENDINRVMRNEINNLFVNNQNNNQDNNQDNNQNYDTFNGDEQGDEV